MHAKYDEAIFNAEQRRRGVLKQYYDAWLPRIGKIVYFDGQITLVIDVEIRYATNAMMTTRLFVDYIQADGECNYIFFDGSTSLHSEYHFKDYEEKLTCA